MAMKLDKTVLSEILSDEQSLNELKEYLNAAIDSELEKSVDDMDTDLIDDCVRIVEAIDEGNISSLFETPVENEIIISLANNSNIVESKTQSAAQNTQSPAKATRTVIRFRRILAVAAIMMILGTVTIQAFPAVATNVKTFFEQMVDNLWNTSNESELEPTEEGEKQILGIDVELPDDASVEVKDIDEVKSIMKNSTYYAFDVDDNKIEIDYNKLTVKYNETTNDEGKACVTVAVGYRGGAQTLTFYIAQ